MPFELNAKIKNLTPYDPIEGSFRIRLDANESFLAPNAQMMEKIAAAVQDVDFNRYPDARAAELCESFARVYDLNPQHITAANGSDELLSLIVQSFLQKGDTLLTMEPDFSMYRFYGALSEANVVTVKKNADFTPDFEELSAQAKAQNARVILFSNPCNPTSVGVGRESILKLIAETDALVVVDEAYMDFFGNSILDEVPNCDNLIVLRTCSKAIGLASLRLGFAVANPTLTKVLQAVKSPYNVNAVSQAIGVALLEEKTYIQRGVKQIIASRDELLAQMKELCAKIPQQLAVCGADANFLFCRAEKAGEAFRFLMEKGIIVRNIGEFLRITAGRNHENAEVVRELAAFYTK